MDESKPETITPINAGDPDNFDGKWADIKTAIAYAIVFGIGIVSGWYLTVSGFFG